MRIVHVKRKSVNSMENVMNVGNIMRSLSKIDPFIVKKKKGVKLSCFPCFCYSVLLDLP